MPLPQLSLAKPGETPKKLSLNLNKGSKFSISLWWDSEHDLDGHALLATNQGNGAKVSAFEQVLSTYNCHKTNPLGMLPVNADGKSFNTPEGALHHSGDARDGRNSDIDEIITIDGGKMPAGVNEVPIFITIHPSKSAKFSLVRQAGIRINDDSGKMLAEYELSNQFGEFDAVQMGSVVLGANGWEYLPVGVGFNGDFNMILDNFS